MHQDPTKDITKDTKNVVIGLKYSWSNVFQGQLHWVPNHTTIPVFYQTKNSEDLTNFDHWWREKDHSIKEVTKWTEKRLSIPPTKIKCESKSSSWRKYQKLDCFLVDNKLEPWVHSEPRAVVHDKYFDYEYFNPINSFIVSLVISFVGSWFKLSRMYWYECMIPFLYHLHLVINNYLCPFHNVFPGIDI